MVCTNASADSNNGGFFETQAELANLATNLPNFPAKFAKFCKKLEIP